MTETTNTTAAPDSADATQSPTGTTTGADSMAAASNEDGAVKSYLGEDAADLAANKDRAAELGVTAPTIPTPTTFEGAQPPSGHVADPTVEGHVGSTGDLSEGTSSDPRPEEAKGTQGTTEENADQAEPGTQTGTSTPSSTSTSSTDGATRQQ